jgi:hypothetical protein
VYGVLTVGCAQDVAEIADIVRRLVLRVDVRRAARDEVFASPICITVFASPNLVVNTNALITYPQSVETD